MALFDLPDDLLLVLGDWADISTVAALASTSRRLHDLLNPVLYRRNGKEDHSSALVWAGEVGCLETVKLCLSYGADINTNFSLHDAPARHWPPSGTSLHFAVLRGHDEIVKYLLDNGADHQVWCRHLCNCEAPVFPSTGGSPVAPAIGFLHDAWTSHWSPLHLALCQGHTSIAKTLIDRGVSCERTLQVTNNIRGNKTEPLPVTFNVVHEIAIHRNSDVLAHLIDTHYPLAALTSTVAFHGSTPLHYLAMPPSQQSSMILSQLLTYVGTDDNVLSNGSSDARPIDVFIFAGDVEAARLLFSLGSRPLFIYECINVATRKRIDLNEWVDYERMEKRDELVIWLLNYGLDTGRFTREHGRTTSLTHEWYPVLITACKQPALLKRFMDEGLKPSFLTPGQVLLLGLITVLSGSKHLGVNLAHPFFESIRLLTRAGERWDTRDQSTPDLGTPLEYLVKHWGSAAPEVRATLFGCLLDTRPPEETGAEQAHFDELCQYTLDHGDTQTHETLVSHAAQGSKFYRRSELAVTAEADATGNPL